MPPCRHAAIPHESVCVHSCTSSKKAGFEAAAQISVGTASLQEPAEALAGLGLGLSAWLKKPRDFRSTLGPLIGCLAMPARPRREASRPVDPFDKQMRASATSWLDRKPCQSLGRRVTSIALWPTKGWPSNLSRNVLRSPTRIWSSGPPIAVDLQHLRQALCACIAFWVERDEGDGLRAAAFGLSELCPVRPSRSSGETSAANAAAHALPTLAH